MSESIKHYNNSKKSKPTRPDSATLKRLLTFVAPHRKLLILALVSLAIASTINLLFPAVIRQLLNENAGYYMLKYPWSSSAILITLFALQALFFYLRSLFFGVIGQRVVNDLRKDIFSSILKQEVAFFDQRQAGDLTSAISSDALLVQDAVSIKLSIFLRYSLQVIGGAILMFLISPLLTGLTILSIPLLFIISKALSGRLKHWSQMQQQRLGEVSASATEAFANIRVVKGLNRTAHEINRFDFLLGKVLEAGINRSRISAFFSSFLSFLLNAVLVLILFYGIQHVLDSNLRIGDLTAFVLYGVIVAVSFAFVVNSYSEFIQALAACERVFEYLDMNTPAAASTDFSDKEAFVPRIDFSEVSFAYRGRDSAPALHKITVQIEAGQTTALVGPSGSGKSTMVNLLMKFYAPDSGTIQVSGKDISLINDSSLRERITFVSQEPMLFSQSVSDNLRYAKPGATIAELEEACKQADLLDFIYSLPDRFETHIGPGGAQLSSGQKQRLSIARALLRKPEILILDEAGAVLDSRSEHNIQEAIKELMKDKTVLVIAHRLSSVQHADKVIVLDEGKIVQSGTHSSLVSQNGLYRELVEKQELRAN